MIGAIDRRISTLVGENLRVLHTAGRFELAEASMCRVKDEGMADLVMNDGIKIVLDIA